MWRLINRLVDTPSLCLYVYLHVLRHISVDMMIILYIYYMCLIIHWILLSYVLIYICLCLHVFVLYDCVLQDFFFLYDAYLAVMFICNIDMLTTSIDSLACFSIWLFLLYDYFAILDMYILIFVYLIHIGVIDSLYCILSCLS